MARTEATSRSIRQRCRLAVEALEDRVTPAAPTTTGLANVAVLEDAPSSLLDLNAAFADAEDADSALAYTVAGNTNAALFAGVSINAGALTLTYAAGAFGFADLTIRATDTQNLFVETVFHVNVHPVNDAPSPAADPEAVVTEDQALSAINVLGNDTAGPANESNQTLFIATASALHGTVVILPDNTLSYTPAPGYFGPDTISYTVSDSINGEIVNLLDDDGDGVADEDAGALWFADSDGDGWGAAAQTLFAAAQPVGYVGNNLDGNDANNLVHPAGNPADFLISFPFTQAQTVTSTLAISVSPVNNPPVNVLPPTLITQPGVALKLKGANRISVSDPDGAGNLQVTLKATKTALQIARPTGVVVTGNNFNTLILTGPADRINAALATLVVRPLTGARGVGTITVTTNDLGNTGVGGPLTDVDTLLIGFANRRPKRAATFARAAKFTTAPNATLNVPASRGFKLALTDPDRDALTFALTVPPAQGDLTVLPTGAFTYTPPPSFKGRITFQISATDGLLSREAWIVIDVL